MKTIIPPTYSMIVIARNTKNPVHTDESPERTLDGSNNENNERLFKTFALSLIPASIFIKKNPIGIPAPNAREFLASLNRQEQKKQIELVTKSWLRL